MERIVVNNVKWTMHNTPKGIWIYQGGPREKWQDEGGWLFEDKEKAMGFMDRFECPKIQFNVW